MKCDHSDGTMAGMCAICGDPVCSECYQSLFNVVICANHEALEDEGEWEVIIVYAEAGAPADSVRFFLDDQGVMSVAVETDDNTVQIFVPIEEKDEAWALLEGGEAGDDMARCDECKVHYARVLAECPVCGKGIE